MTLGWKLYNFSDFFTTDTFLFSKSMIFGTFKTLYRVLSTGSLKIRFKAIFEQTCFFGGGGLLKVSSGHCSTLYPLRTPRWFVAGQQQLQAHMGGKAHAAMVLKDCQVGTKWVQSGVQSGCNGFEGCRGCSRRRTSYSQREEVCAAVCSKPRRKQQVERRLQQFAKVLQRFAANTARFNPKGESRHRACCLLARTQTFPPVPACLLRFPLLKTIKNSTTFSIVWRPIKKMACLIFCFTQSKL